LPCSTGGGWRLRSTDPAPELTQRVADRVTD
jgi:hypothetical protein